MFTFNGRARTVSRRLGSPRLSHSAHGSSHRTKTLTCPGPPYVTRLTAPPDVPDLSGLARLKACSRFDCKMCNSHAEFQSPQCRVSDSEKTTKNRSWRFRC